MAVKKSSFSAFSAKMVVIRQIYVILYPTKAVTLQQISKEHYETFRNTYFCIEHNNPYGTNSS